MAVLLLCNIGMEPLKKQFQEKEVMLQVNLLKYKMFPTISLYEEFFKLEASYTHLTKVQIYRRDSLLDFLELKKDFLKVLASAHFKYLIQHLTNMLSLIHI